MSIISNAYKLPNCPSTISHHDSRVYDGGRIDASSPYPSCCDILASVSAEFGGGDSLEECHNRDALFVRATPPSKITNCYVKPDRPLSRAR